MTEIKAQQLTRQGSSEKEPLVLHRREKERALGGGWGVGGTRLPWGKHVAEKVVRREDEASDHGRLHEEHGLVHGPQQGRLQEHANFFRPYPVFFVFFCSFLFIF